VPVFAGALFCLGPARTNHLIPTLPAINLCKAGAADLWQVTAKKNIRLKKTDVYQFMKESN